MTTVERKPFGNLDSGENVEKLILTNKNGVVVEVHIFNKLLSFIFILVKHIYAWMVLLTASELWSNNRVC